MSRCRFFFIFFSSYLYYLSLYRELVLTDTGASPLTPYLTTMAKQRGYSAQLVGVIFSVLPLAAVFARPIFGAVADRFRCQKTMFLCSIVVVILITTSYDFLPDPPADVNNHGRDEIALATHQFWLFCAFLAAICQHISTLYRKPFAYKP